MSTKTIQIAIDLLGGQSVAARLIGVHSATVSQWVSGLRPMPLHRAMQLEVLTDGSVLAEEMAPDFAQEIDMFRTFSISAAMRFMD